MFIQLTSAKNLTKVTGCLTKCKYTRHDYQEQANEAVKWKTDWISSFYLMPKSASSEYIEEYYEYKFGDLLADFGSYLGLFLGWSLLSISRDVPVWLTWLKNIFKRVFNKYNSAHQVKQENGPVDTTDMDREA